MKEQFLANMHYEEQQKSNFITSMKNFFAIRFLVSVYNFDISIG